jgi:hypothetical protein
VAQNLAIESLEGETIMPIKLVNPSELRKWTPEEVDEVIAFIKQQQPDVWTELEKVEATTGDFTDIAAYDVQMALAMGYFKITSLFDLGNLLAAIGRNRREALGLSLVH